MPTNIKAGIYILFAVFVALVFLLFFFNSQSKAIKKIGAGWAVLSAIAFSAPFVEMYFFLSAIALLLMMPKKMDDAVQFYAAMITVIPGSIVWEISAPGIKEVIELNYVILLSWTLLIPIYLRSKNTTDLLHKKYSAGIQARKVFYVLITFLFIGMMLDWRGFNFTTAIRNSLERYFGLIFILIVLFSVCDSRKMVDKILFGLMVSGVFVATIACMESLTDWKIYNSISHALIGDRSVMSNIKQYRNGFLRPTAMMLPIPLGFYLSISFVIGFYFYRLKKLGQSEYGGTIMVLIPIGLALFFTGSRGAWLVVFLMLAMTFVLKRNNKILRTVIILCLVISTGFMGQILDQFIALDPHGTFQYRLNLIGNSWTAIQDNFFTGNNNFRQHPAMLLSMQGEGIVDVVNVYLSVALDYGVPMALVFLFVPIRVSLLLSKARKFDFPVKERELIELQSRFIQSIIVGSAIMIATVSFVDRIQHFYMISVVLGICIYRYVMIVRRMSLDSPTENPVAMQPAQESNKQGPFPSKR